MKNRLLAGVGGLVAIVGIIWTLQGLGVVGGSVMTGETLWAVVGPIVALAGLAMVVASLRGRRSTR
jgi:hypothetical protein